ncbi:MAG TPA: GTPase Era, partial [Acholeplasmataceae bacterium]|nr:GTPase Era [Acholeplasmataceae bacterium]
AFVPVSSITGQNLDKLIELTLKELPEDGLLFPEDFVSNQTERMRMMELIREKILLHTKEEIPHSVAVVIENIFYNEELDQYDVYADILVEKSSQKQILIGKNGEKIKTIGTAARLDINKTLKTKVHLVLWVKVKKDWRNDERMLTNLGIGEDY